MGAVGWTIWSALTYFYVVLKRSSELLSCLDCMGSWLREDEFLPCGCCAFDPVALYGRYSRLAAAPDFSRRPG